MNGLTYFGHWQIGHPNGRLLDCVSTAKATISSSLRKGSSPLTNKIVSCRTMLVSGRLALMGC